MVLLDFLYGQEFLKKVPPGLLSKSFLFPIFLPYFLYNYLLLGRPILKLIRHLSVDEQIPTHQLWANSRFLLVESGKRSLPRHLNALKNDRAWMAETEHLQFNSSWIVTDS